MEETRRDNTPFNRLKTINDLFFKTLCFTNSFLFGTNQDPDASSSQNPWKFHVFDDIQRRLDEVERFKRYKNWQSHRILEFQDLWKTSIILLDTLREHFANEK